MIFHSSPLQDVRLIELQPFGDERGTFARTFCVNEFTEAGLPTTWLQQNISSSRLKGTIRGLHFQHAPHTEAKLVRCVRGAILDVIVDLRADSPTYLKHGAFELIADKGNQLFVPQGFAHGFQTLTDNVEVTYLVTACYDAKSEGGLRYNDPSLQISWPLAVSAISDKDASWPDIDARAPISL